jgi:hypothetical protein
LSAFDPELPDEFPETSHSDREKATFDATPKPSARVIRRSTGLNSAFAA